MKMLSKIYRLAIVEQYHTTGVQLETLKIPWRSVVLVASRNDHEGVKGHFWEGAGHEFFLNLLISTK